MANKHLSYKVFKRIFGDLGNTVRTVYNWTMGGPYNKITKTVQEAGYVIDAYVKDGLSNYITKTINLFDLGAPRVETYGVATITGTQVSITGNYYCSWEINLKAGKTYYIGFEVISGNVNNAYIRLYFADGTLSDSVYRDGNRFTASKDVIKVLVYCSSGTTNTIVYDKIIFNEDNQYINGNYFPYFTGEKFLVLVGQVDLGDLSYEFHPYSGTYEDYFDTTLPSNSILGNSLVIPNIRCKNYTPIKSPLIATTGYDDMVISIGAGTRRLILCNKLFNNADNFKNANIGNPLDYQLETPVLVDIE